MDLSIIRDLRRSRKMTAKELARLAGISSVSLSRIECNKIDPGINKIERICIELGCELRIIMATEKHD